MKLLSALAVGGTAVLMSGCAAFMSSEYGPYQVHGNQLEDVINSAGAPDIIGGNDHFIVCGWRHRKTLSVLGIFETASEATSAIVCDDTGYVIGSSTVNSGSALAVFGFGAASAAGANLR